jgi:hypothetical protein
VGLVFFIHFPNRVQTMDKQALRALVRRVYDRMAAVSVDELLCSPLLAMHFCQQVRQAGGVLLADYDVLHTLLGMRKTGALRHRADGAQGAAGV